MCHLVTGVQTCALPILLSAEAAPSRAPPNCTILWVPNAAGLALVASCSSNGAMIAPPASCVDDSGSPLCAADVARGVTRLLLRHGLVAMGEVPLDGGRRADLMAIDAKGGIVIVEIKVADRKSTRLNSSH